VDHPEAGLFRWLIGHPDPGAGRAGDLPRFEHRCLWKKVDEARTIIDFDDPSSDVYFLVSGDVRIELRTAGGREFILADLREGEFFGEFSAIDGEPSSAKATALNRATICIV
jgi:CRP-like cAMP-binding protein